MILLPLSISAASLVLSLAKIFMDFRGTLNEIDSERCFADRIKQRNETSCHREENEKEKQMLEQMRKLEQHTFTGPAGFVENRDATQYIMKQYIQEIQAIDDSALTLLDKEFSSYRTRLEETKCFMCGAAHINRENRIGNAEHVKYEGQKQTLRTKVHEIRDTMLKSIRELDLDGQDDVYVASDIEIITKQGQKKTMLFEKQIGELTKNAFLPICTKSVSRLSNFGSRRLYRTQCNTYVTVMVSLGGGCMN